jgi:hypothetical protein
MKVHLIIPVEYKGEKLEFRAKLLEGSFGYKFKLKVEGGEIVFEQDKEEKFKVAVKPAKLVRDGKIDMGLVEAIKGVVDEAVK